MARYRSVPANAIKVAIPSVTQRAGHTCGAAALLAVSAYYGVGPGDEAQLARDMRMTPDGSDPAHLLRAITKYRLRSREYRGMTDHQLRACLDRRRPVIIMLQAWGRRRSYAGVWTEGHWVVAIGYDRAGVYVEDPLIAGDRGFVTWRALDERWHDIEGAAKHQVTRYGLAVWRPAGGMIRRVPSPRDRRPAVRVLE